jgi:hypothetical protein
VSGVIGNSGTIALTSAGAGASLTVKAGSSVGGGVGGVISAGAGTKVTFAGASVSHQTLMTSGGGQILMTSTGNVLNAVTVSGGMTINNGATVTLEGSLSGIGTISLAAKGVLTEAIIGTAPMAATVGSGMTLALGDNALNEVVGVLSGPSYSTFTIAGGGTVAGSGQLGAGQMQLLVQSGGVVDATGATVALTIDTGTATITNHGTIEASGAAGGLVKSAVSGGVLASAGGTLTVAGAVTGSGGQVNGGVLDFEGSFSGAVSFTGSAGTLLLAHSQTYTGSISGFSTTGGEFLDLKDVSFISASEASFSGNTKSGTLTVSDGTNVAHIHLTGNYFGSVFVCSDDGHGGVLITDPPAAAAAPPTPQAMVQAQATLAPPAAAAAVSPIVEASRRWTPVAASPHSHFS